MPFVIVIVNQMGNKGGLGKVRGDEYQLSAGIVYFPSQERLVSRGSTAAATEVLDIIACCGGTDIVNISNLNDDSVEVLVTRISRRACSRWKWSS